MCDMVSVMKFGLVVVDFVVESGGNVEGLLFGEEVVVAVGGMFVKMLFLILWLLVDCMN